jgi:hypothetical protein
MTTPTDPTTTLRSDLARAQAELAQARAERDAARARVAQYGQTLQACAVLGCQRYQSGNCIDYKATKAVTCAACMARRALNTSTPTGGATWAPGEACVCCGGVVGVPQLEEALRACVPILNDYANADRVAFAAMREEANRALTRARAALAGTPAVSAQPVTPTGDGNRVRELERLIVNGANWQSAPCCLCGYNGPGYYQPETHACAALFGAARQEAPAAAPGCKHGMVGLCQRCESERAWDLIGKLTTERDAARAVVESQRAALDALRLITVQMSNVVYNCKQGDAARWLEGREKLIGLQEQYDAWVKKHGAALRGGDTKGEPSRIQRGNGEGDGNG